MEPNVISPDGIIQAMQPGAPANNPPPPVVEPKQPKVEPTVEPKDSKEEPAVDFNEFLTVKAAPVKETPKAPVSDTKPKTPETPKVEEPKLEPKVEPKLEVKPDSNQRDYSELDEQEIPLLKKMSNEAFEYVKPKLKQLKEVQKTIAEKESEIKKLQEGRIPDSYYENPDAFVLTPEFQEVSANLSAAQTVTSHWKTQLNAIAEGADEVENLVLDQTGNLVPGPKMKVDNSTRDNIILKINEVQRFAYQYEVKKQSIAENYNKFHQENVNALRGFEQKFFPHFEDPKNTQLQALLKDTVSKMPPAFRNSPAMQTAAKALLMLNAAVKRVQDLESKLVAGVASKPSVTPVPKEGEVDTGIKGGEPEVSFDQFQRLKAGL